MDIDTMMPASNTTATAAYGQDLTKKKGRPLIEDERFVRDSLLNAAMDLLQKKGYHKISTREIAARAGTNLAMITYYFGGKGGLFVALIEIMFAELHERIGNLDKTALLLHPHPNVLFVNRLQSVYVRWQEVVRLFSSEAVAYNTSLRESFKKRIAKKVFDDVFNFLTFMVDHGIYRHDIDVRSMSLLLASVLVAPYHVTPFLAAISDSQMTPMDPERWSDALVGMFDGLLLAT